MIRYVPHFHKLGNVIDVASHPTHAMNTIDRQLYVDEEWPMPARRHRFKCMFCGALDRTDKASARCPWG